MLENSPGSENYDVLLRKLNSIADVLDEEKRALAGLPLQIQHAMAGEVIVHDGSQPDHCCLLIDGMMSRYKILDEGRRQIVAFHTPGDIPDLQSLHLKTLDHTLGAVTACRLGFIPHVALHDLTRQNPAVAALLWRDTLIDAAIFREWVVNVGARSAFARISHLFCEVYTRLRAVGLGTDNGFELPLTQGLIGEATGLSTVHVNRTMMDMRRAGLIASKGRSIEILNWDDLRRAAGFSSTYLHLKVRP